MTSIDEARANAGLTPKACPADCACPCHGDDENPGPHLGTCALIDPDFEPGDTIVETTPSFEVFLPGRIFPMRVDGRTTRTIVKKRET